MEKLRPITYMFVVGITKGAVIGSCVMVLAMTWGLAFEPYDVVTPLLTFVGAIVVGAIGGSGWGIIIGTAWGLVISLLTWLAIRWNRPRVFEWVAIGIILCIAFPWFALPALWGFLDWLAFVFVIFTPSVVALAFLHSTRVYFRKVKAYSRKAKEKPKRKNSEVIASDYDAHTLAMHADVTIREQEEQAS